MQVTCISSFSNIVFYPFVDQFIIWATHKLLSTNAFNFDESQILSFGEDLYRLPYNPFC